MRDANVLLASSPSRWSAATSGASKSSKAARADGGPAAASSSASAKRFSTRTASGRSRSAEGSGALQSFAARSNTRPSPSANGTPAPPTPARRSAARATAHRRPSNKSSWLSMPSSTKVASNASAPASVPPRPPRLRAPRRDRDRLPMAASCRHPVRGAATATMPTVTPATKRLAAQEHGSQRRGAGLRCRRGPCPESGLAAQGRGSRRHGAGRSTVLAPAVARLAVRSAATMG
mmetsp:Transcript_86920/g.243575  ORF Transcript_86920/g.243575 Transcript_86920/m.243575 type:complete len:234 (-) Transcript_86920:20-721(-)